MFNSLYTSILENTNTRNKYGICNQYTEWNSKPDPKSRMHFYPRYKAQLHVLENNIIRSIPHVNLFPKQVLYSCIETSFYGYYMWSSTDEIISY